MNLWRRTFGNQVERQQRLTSIDTDFAGGYTTNIPNTLPSYDQYGFKGNPPIYSLISIRAKALAEGRFLFRDRLTLEVDDPPRLDLLHRPWTGATTGTLLSLMEVMVSLAGNAYVRRLNRAGSKRPAPRLELLRPDWVDIVYAVDDADGGTDLLGYLYTPGGAASGKTPISLPADEVAHYIEMPDPTGVFRGQSWITATTRDVDADTNMARHRAKFFHGGTPNLAVVHEKSVNPKALEAAKAQFRNRFEGVDNAYKTVFLEGGADLKVIGSQMEQMSFSTVQATGETRLAAAAGVPPVVVGFVSGIQAATYSNYAQAMRRFADLSIRPAWRNAAGALATVVPPPAGSELWYDDRKIPFLQQDALDEAKIRHENSKALYAIASSGFDPMSGVEYMDTNDITKLTHTGLPSVQLQPAENVDPSPTGDKEGDDDAE